MTTFHLTIQLNWNIFTLLTKSHQTLLPQSFSGALHFPNILQNIYTRVSTGLCLPSVVLFWNAFRKLTAKCIEQKVSMSSIVVLIVCQYVVSSASLQLSINLFGLFWEMETIALSYPVYTSNYSLGYNQCPCSCIFSP